MTTSGQKYFKTCDVILCEAVVFFGLYFVRAVLNCLKKLNFWQTVPFIFVFFSNFVCSGNTFLVATELKIGLTHSTWTFLCLIHNFMHLYTLRHKEVHYYAWGKFEWVATAGFFDPWNDSVFGSTIIVRGNYRNLKGRFIASIWFFYNHSGPKMRLYRLCVILKSFYLRTLNLIKYCSNKAGHSNSYNFFHA